MRLFKLIATCLLALYSNADAQVPGAIAGEFNVSESGSATYNIPLSLPPGTSGLSPTLALSYSSGAPSGLMGPGWSLSGLSSITRCGGNVPTDGYISGVRLQTSDKFCLDGQKLLPVATSSGSPEYRTQIESFSRILAVGISGNGPNYFTVELKNGQKLEYGATPDSKLRNTSATVLTWNLNKVTDRLGNYYTVSYYQDTAAGFTLPQTISYTGNTAANLAPYNQVVIDYDPRSTIKENFIGGERFTLQHRIRKVSTFAESALAMTYNISYDVDPVTGEDRVSSVQQCSTPNTCLPPTTFEWTGNNQGNAAFVPGQTFQNLSPAQGLWSNYHYPIFSGDFNGDGLTDLMRVELNDTLTCLNSKNAGFTTCNILNAFGQQSYNETNSKPMILGDWTGNGRTGVARSTGSQITPFVANSDGSFTHINDLNALASPHGYNDQARDPLFTGDWNGDGRTDIARGHLSGNGLFVIDFRLANGNGFDANAIAIVTLSDPNNYYPYVFTGDWDGDGLTDFGVTWEDRPVGTNEVHLWRSTGMGFTLFQNLPQPTISAGNDSFSSIYEGIFVGDWNGDGLSDFAISGFNGIKFYRSNGLSMNFWYDLNDLGRYQIPGVNSANTSENPFITGDWNGDGRTDIARVRNNNTRFYAATSSGFQQMPDLADLSPVHGYPNIDTRPILAGDWNGDGMTDIARVSATGVVMYVQTTTDNAKIKRITDGLGKETRITYGNLTDPTVYTKGLSAAFPQVDVQGSGDVVSIVSSSDGLGSFASAAYHYSTLIMDNARRDSKGFQRIDIVDGTTGIVTTTTYLQQYPFENKVHSTERRLSSGTLIERSTNTWGTIAPSNVSLLPVPTQTMEEQFELNGSLTISTSTTRAFDLFGNLTQNSIVRSDGSTELTVNTFSNNLPLWMLGQLTAVSVTKRAGGLNPPPAITRTTSFAYYAPSGLLYFEIPENGNSAYRIYKSYTYDVFGNTINTVVSGVDFATRTTTKTYDSKGRFTTRITNPLGQAENRQYSAKTGAITSITDINGIVVQHSYDDFGRLILETRPDGTQTQVVFAWPDQSAPSNAAYFVRTLTTGAPTTKVYFDELGREIQSVSDGFRGREIKKDKVYDSRGDVVLVSEPYFAGDTVLWNAIDYDILGRTIRNTNPGNLQTTYSYNGFTTTTTNPVGQTRTEIVDSLGKLVQVIDTQGNILQILRDSYSNPLQTTAGAGNVTTVQYDLTGRKTQITDPDSGTTSYSYNHLGELISQTNALGQVTQLTYDVLGRVTSRSSADGVESWIYDVAPHGVGKLSSITGRGGFHEQYSYDNLGRLIQTATTIGSNSFIMTQSYDNSGRPNVTTYPSGWGIKNSYDSTGTLQAILQASDNSTIWKVVAENARGQLESQTFGNGLSTTQTFDPLRGYLMRTTTGTVQDLSYQYDTLGNLTQRNDLQRNLSENFVYDNLSRLTSSQVVGQNQVQISYNALGNITYKSDVGTYSYLTNGVRPHAVTSISGPLARSLTYNQRGARTSGTNSNIQYSVSGHPTYVRDGTNSIQFDLDPADSRIEERRYQGTTLVERKQFLSGGLYERIEKGTAVSLVHYIKGPAGFVAQKVINTTMSGTVTGGAIGYIHLDNLGSIQTITDHRGNIRELLSFDSWGNRRDPYTWSNTPSRFKSTTDRGFTGHEQLDSVSLIHMNGRIYDPVIGKFVSADPFIDQPADLQAYNRYSYVHNNPLSYTDPSGYFSFRSLRKMVLRTARMLIRQAITNAVMAVANSVGGPLAGPFLAAYAGNFTTSLLNGNGLSKSYHAGFRHLVVNALHAKLDNLVGHGFSGDGGFSKYGALALAAAHAVADAGYAAATGGNVRAAFMSGFGGSLGASAGDYIKGSLGSGQVAGHIGAAIGGGTAAALGGGKFEDGAMRGAFIYMYNHSFSGLEQAVGDAAARARYGAPQLPTFSNPYSISGLALDGINGIGEAVSDASLYLKLGSNGLFFVADRMPGPIGNIFRAPGLLIGSLGLIGSSPTGKIGAAMQANYMLKLSRQTAAFFTFGGIGTLGPSDMPKIPTAGHGF